MPAEPRPRLRSCVARTSLGDSVYQALLDAVVGGELPPGSELNEVALAADLGVSRTPVHGAIARLIKDGLVEVGGNRKARVVCYTRDDVRDIYEMRLLLEPAATEKAARALSDEAIAALRSEADALAKAPPGKGWATRALDFDVRFHDQLAAASGNPRLHAEITRYRQLVRAFCRMTGGTDNLRDALDEHRAILAALVARDALQARQAMAAHIAARQEAVLRSLPAPSSSASGDS